MLATTEVPDPGLGAEAAQRGVEEHERVGEHARDVPEDRGAAECDPSPATNGSAARSAAAREVPDPGLGAEAAIGGGKRGPGKILFCIKLLCMRLGLVRVLF